MPGDANCNLAVTQMTQLVALNSSLERPSAEAAPALERRDVAQFFGEQKHSYQGESIQMIRKILCFMTLASGLVVGSVQAAGSG